MTNTVPRISCVQICLHLAAKIQNFFLLFFLPFYLSLLFFGVFLRDFLLVPLHFADVSPLALTLLGILASYSCRKWNESLHFSDEYCYTHAFWIFIWAKQRKSQSSSSYYNQHLLQADPSPKTLERWLTSPRMKDSLFRNFPLQIGIWNFLCSYSTWKCVCFFLAVTCLQELGIQGKKCQFENFNWQHYESCCLLSIDIRIFCTFEFITHALLTTP